MPKLPKLGMRIVKSAIAVFICLVIDLVRNGGTPFYSVIAAILCMQPQVSNGVRLAINRIIGTLVGGAVGCATLYVLVYCFPSDLLILRYFLIAVMIIPLIYFTASANRASASYITCVVFLSITISHSADLHPFLFAVNRIVDTLIGIVVSLAVNAFHIPGRGNRGILFLIEPGSLQRYGAVRLARLIDRGAMVSAYSALTPPELQPFIEGTGLHLPAIVMHGAALYDLENAAYTHCKLLDEAQQVLKRVQEAGFHCFAYTVVHHVLQIHYEGLQNPAQAAYHEHMRMRPGCSLVYGLYPRSCLMIKVIEPTQALTQLVEGLDHVSYYVTENRFAKGYAELDICAAAVSEHTAAIELQQLLQAPRMEVLEPTTDLAQMEKLFLKKK